MIQTHFAEKKINWIHFQKRVFKYVMHISVSYPGHFPNCSIVAGPINDNPTLVQVMAGFHQANKPLLKTMLTQMYVAIWCHKVTMI